MSTTCEEKDMTTKVSVHGVTKVTTEVRHIESDTCGSFTTTDLRVETKDGKEELVITLFHKGELKIE